MVVALKNDGCRHPRQLSGNHHKDENDNHQATIEKPSGNYSATVLATVRQPRQPSPKGRRNGCRLSRAASYSVPAVRASAALSPSAALAGRSRNTTARAVITTQINTRPLNAPSNRRTEQSRGRGSRNRPLLPFVE